MYTIPSRASDAGPDQASNHFHEPLHCGSCDAICAELTPCTWDTSLLVGPCCQFHEDDMEPACECRYIDVDEVDARGCELHDSSSPWNVRQRVAERIAAQAAMLAEIGCTPAEVDAFEKFPRKQITRQQGEITFGEVA
jgi:hypothetical protein